MDQGWWTERPLREVSWTEPLPALTWVALLTPVAVLPVVLNDPQVGVWLMVLAVVVVGGLFAWRVASRPVHHLRVFAGGLVHERSPGPTSAVRWPEVREVHAGAAGELVVVAATGLLSVPAGLDQGGAFALVQQLSAQGSPHPAQAPAPGANTAAAQGAPTAAAPHVHTAAMPGGPPPGSRRSTGPWVLAAAVVVALATLGIVIGVTATRDEAPARQAAPSQPSSPGSVSGSMSPSMTPSTPAASASVPTSAFTYDATRRFTGEKQLSGPTSAIFDAEPGFLRELAVASAKAKMGKVSYVSWDVTERTAYATRGEADGTSTGFMYRNGAFEATPSTLSGRAGDNVIDLAAIPTDDLVSARANVDVQLPPGYRESGGAGLIASSPTSVSLFVPVIDTTRPTRVGTRCQYPETSVYLNLTTRSSFQSRPVFSGSRTCVVG